MTIEYHAPTSVMRFVNRDGRFILQQWWGLYRIDRERNRNPTNEGYWEDIPNGPEMPVPPTMSAHYRPVGDA